MYAKTTIALTMTLIIATSVAITVQGQSPLAKVKNIFNRNSGKTQDANNTTAVPTAPVVQTFDAKVHETLMGPLVTNGITSPNFLSADGDHLAIVTAKGSRQVVMLDGVEGPVFDEIPQIFLGIVPVAVQWSATGGHSAYLGRRGGDLIAVIDGKEAAPVATSQTQ